MRPPGFEPGLKDWKSLVLTKLDYSRIFVVIDRCRRLHFYILIKNNIMSDFDVSVVGASLIGGVAARECAKRGLKVALIDEDKVVGKNHRCTAIYSASGLKLTGVNFQPSILNKINGATIHSLSNTLTIKTKETKAYVLDRQRFDEISVQQAVNEGAELFLDNRIIGFDGGPYSRHNKFSSKIIIGADGARSFTAKHFNFPAIKNFIYCYEAELTDLNVANKTLVDVFLDNKLFPGFFGWVVPVSNYGARIGFGVKDPSRLLKTRDIFLSKPEINQLIDRGKKVREFFAPIPISQRSVTQKGKVILVGDAAGQVKATTGGGVIFGSMGATKAAESTANHIFDGKVLNYDNVWRAQYGHVLTGHSVLRALMDNVDNRITDISFGVASALGFNRLFESFGDMDFILKPLTAKV